MTPIVLDSSALIALAYPNDADHANALRISEQIEANNQLILIPNEVLSESLNIMGKKFGHAMAAETGQFVIGEIARGAFLIPNVGESHIALALRKFAVQPGSVSYTDSLVMAVADSNETDLIFGFDEVFQKNGYKLPEAA